MQKTSNEPIGSMTGEQHSIVTSSPRILPSHLPTVHYTELTEAPPDSPIMTEWNLYRREISRLLAEGHEGKWILIKGIEIAGIWDTYLEACQAQRSLPRPGMIKQILQCEPLLRIGYNPLCRS